MGLGIARLTDATHEDVRYVYSPPPDTLLQSTEYFASSGCIWEALGGVAVSVSPWLNLGVSAGERFGTIARDYEIDDATGPDGDTTWTEKTEEAELCWHLGATVPFGLNSASVSYASGSDNYPARLAAGGMIFTGTQNRGAIGVEGELRDPGGDNQVVARAFGQYSPEESLVFLGGVSFTEASEDELTTIIVSGGGVYSLPNFQFEAAIEWSNTTSSDSSWAHDEPDQIRDSVTSILFGISYVP